jgi:hypothetical protein
MAFSALVLLWTRVFTWLGLKFYNIVFNVFFHPLRAFPGSLCAKATTWWKAYYQLLQVKEGCWESVLAKLHAQYGGYCALKPSFQHSSHPQRRGHHPSWAQ